MSGSSKNISCIRCWQRKIKCSRTVPCTNCGAARVDCGYREHDSKRAPVTRGYTDALERRIVVLEALIARRDPAVPGSLGELTPSAAQRDPINSVVVQQSRNAPSSASFNDIGNRPLTANLFDSQTSVFDDLPRSTRSGNDPNSAIDLPPIIPSGYRATVTTYVALFFKYQYSTSMFIDREAFLLDFEHWWSGRSGDRYDCCDTSLVYAISAIGASMSNAAGPSDARQVFHSTAVRRVMVEVLRPASTCTIQTLLCLATYALGHNDTSHAWLLSGMALRLSQGLGFQRDPAKHTDQQPSDRYSKKESLRRIYWGCYVTDKVFSLLLGRPLSMYDEDADVEISTPAAQIPIFNDFLTAHSLDHLIEPIPALPRYVHVLNNLIKLTSIIHTMLKRLFTPNSSGTRTITEIAVAVSDLDTRLLAFQDALPLAMRFQPWIAHAPAATPILSPRLASLHAIYHAARLTLYKPLVFLAASACNDSAEDPRTRNSTTPRPITDPVALTDFDGAHTLHASVDSVRMLDALATRFRAQHYLSGGLRVAPVVMVHALLIALNVVTGCRIRRNTATPAGPIATSDGRQVTDMVLSQRYGPTHDEGWAVLDSYGTSLHAALAEMAPSWELAATAAEKLRGMLGSADLENQDSGDHRHPQPKNSGHGVIAPASATVEEGSGQSFFTTTTNNSGMNIDNDANMNWTVAPELPAHYPNQEDDWRSFMSQFDLDYGLEAFEGLFAHDE